MVSSVLAINKSGEDFMYDIDKVYRESLIDSFTFNMGNLKSVRSNLNIERTSLQEIKRKISSSLHNIALAMCKLAIVGNIDKWATLAHDGSHYLHNNPRGETLYFMNELLSKKDLILKDLKALILVKRDPKEIFYDLILSFYNMGNPDARPGGDACIRNQFCPAFRKTQASIRKTSRNKEVQELARSLRDEMRKAGTIPEKTIKSFSRDFRILKD